MLQLWCNTVHMFPWHGGSATFALGALGRGRTKLSKLFVFIWSACVSSNVNIIHILGGYPGMSLLGKSHRNVCAGLDCNSWVSLRLCFRLLGNPTRLLDSDIWLISLHMGTCVVRWQVRNHETQSASEWVCFGTDIHFMVSVLPTVSYRMMFALSPILTITHYNNKCHRMVDWWSWLVTYYHGKPLYITGHSSFVYAEHGQPPIWTKPTGPGQFGKPWFASWWFGNCPPWKPYNCHIGDPQIPLEPNRTFLSAQVVMVFLNALFWYQVTLILPLGVAMGWFNMIVCVCMCINTFGIFRPQDDLTFQYMSEKDRKRWWNILEFAMLLSCCHVFLFLWHWEIVCLIMCTWYFPLLLQQGYLLYIQDYPSNKSECHNCYSQLLAFGQWKPMLFMLHVLVWVEIWSGSRFVSRSYRSLSGNKLFLPQQN